VDESGWQGFAGGNAEYGGAPMDDDSDSKDRADIRRICADLKNKFRVSQDPDSWDSYGERTQRQRWLNDLAGRLDSGKLPMLDAVVETEHTTSWPTHPEEVEEPEPDVIKVPEVVYPPAPEVPEHVAYEVHKRKARDTDDTMIDCDRCGKRHDGWYECT
jgi:hypothetical protein